MSMATTATVVNAFAETYRVTISFEERINQFLDHLLEVQREYKFLLKNWNEVNTLTHQYVSNCYDKNQLTVILLSLEGLISTAERIFEKNSKTWKRILPSIDNEFCDKLEHIKEIQSDIRIKISENPDLLESEEKLLSLGF
jgi:hypothetical protein